MKDKIILLLATLLLMPVVLGDNGIIETYVVNEVFDVSLHLSDENGNVVGANCNVQIRNHSFDVIEEKGLNEINQGWYNGTYNTSQAGKYFCRQNCTLGALFAADTCDFIIQKTTQEESNKMIQIIATILFFAILLFWFGLKQEDPWLVFFAGFAFTVTGIFTFIDGIDLGNQVLRNAWTQSFSLVIFGLGLYLVLRTATEILDRAFTKN